MTVLPVNWWHVIIMYKSYIVCNVVINTPSIAWFFSFGFSDFKVMGDFIQGGQGENSQVTYLKVCWIEKLLCVKRLLNDKSLISCRLMYAWVQIIWYYVLFWGTLQSVGWWQGNAPNIAGGLVGTLLYILEGLSLIPITVFHLFSLVSCNLLC